MKRSVIITLLLIIILTLPEGIRGQSQDPAAYTSQGMVPQNTPQTIYTTNNPDVYTSNDQQQGLTQDPVPTDTPPDGGGDPGAPIDGGVWFLLAAGVLYGVIRYRRGSGAWWLNTGSR